MCYCISRPRKWLIFWTGSASTHLNRYNEQMVHRLLPQWPKSDLCVVHTVGAQVAQGSLIQPPWKDLKHVRPAMSTETFQRHDCNNHRNHHHHHQSMLRYHCNHQVILQLHLCRCNYSYVHQLIEGKGRMTELRERPSNMWHDNKQTFQRDCHAPDKWMQKTDQSVLLASTSAKS